MSFNIPEEMYSAPLSTKNFTLLGIILFTVFLAFYRITASEIQLSDESRVAVNALEMYHNGNFITTYFNGSPDTLNTKPPFPVWCTVVSMKIFGVNEFAIRLPNALAFILLSFFTFLYIRKITGDEISAFFCSLVILTFPSLASLQVFRTGDYDSMLVLWVTLYCFSYFEYLKTNNIKYVNYFFTFFILACFTGGVAAFFALPGLALYFLLFNRRFEIFKVERFLYLTYLTIFLIIGYYFLRESQNPGYVNLVITKELGGRYFKSLESYKQFWDTSWQVVVNLQIPFWIFLLLFLIKDKVVKHTIYFSLIVAFFIALGISPSKAKLDWYIVQTFPFIAICIGLFIGFIYKHVNQYLSDNVNENILLKPSVINTAFILLIIFPIYKVVKVINEREVVTNGKYIPVKEALADLKNYKTGSKKSYAIFSDSSTSLAFYMTKFNHENNCDIHFDRENYNDTILLIKGTNWGIREIYRTDLLFESANMQVLARSGLRFNFPLTDKDLIFIKHLNEIKNSQDLIKLELDKIIYNNNSIMTQIILDAGYLMEMNNEGSKEEIAILINKYTEEYKKGNLFFASPNVQDLSKSGKYFNFPLNEKDFTFLGHFDKIKNSEALLKVETEKIKYNNNPMMVQILIDAGYLMEINGQGSKDEINQLVNKYTEEYKMGNIL
ncbi:MAG: glycosyltransferase family 39 protein [Sporocytophaga sp.]|uniref:ArnT family glycosyltransferase n=1 Tax=Sporocytophaga sp. TaxID=2231183 RepID=UPI001B0EB2B6|nr:glycosyltransferase family 39 protein [Sporocytophaga sp.]MBO9701505.1 glycosyltransferase family 39 protein [Sporocytophaga sp.]